MRKTGILVLACMAAGAGHGAGIPAGSPFLLRPDTGKVLVRQIADFWKSYRDDNFGGYRAVVAPSGTGNGEIKYFSPQSRLAYVFTRAFMVTGDTTYLNHAEHALEFLYAHAWDTSRTGGWFYQAQEDGRFPLPDSVRWSYMQHYALLGPTVFWEAHGGQRFPRSAGAISHWDWIRRGSDWLESRLWDSTPGREGYYSYLYPSGGKGKGFTGTVDGITTHGEILALITREKAFQDRFVSLGEAMANHLVPAMDSSPVKLGMPEEFTSDWGLDTNSYAMVGHIVKTVWCLNRVFLYRPDPRYLAASERTFRRVWDNGFVDTVNGGVYYDYSWRSPNSLRTQKNYWMLEQGFNAGITLAHLTNDSVLARRALRMAEGSVDFFYKYIYQKNGGAIMSTTATGSPQLRSLGDEWDAGYHASEFSWLVYLYGHLLHQRDSVSLFYRLAPSATAQEIALTPMSLPGDSLAILSVSKDGVPFDRVDQMGRILHLEPGEGGIFRVSFGWRNSRTESVRATPSKQAWKVVWDRGSKRLGLDLPSPMDLKVRVFDAKGALQADLGTRGYPSGVSSLELPREASKGLRWVVVETQGVRQVVFPGL